MPTFRLGLFFLLFLSLINKSSAQQQDTVYSDINDALKNPEKVFYLSLDCDENNDSLFYANITRFTNLGVLTISNSKNKFLSEKISALKNLQRLYITTCTNIDFEKLFNQLSLVNDLKTLSLNDCGLKSCPKEIQKLKSLQSLIITDNDEFDTEQLVKQVSKLPKLQKLALPINQITDLPENISSLKQIEVLDLSNNWLTDLPDEIAQMKNLENLDISGNIIISPLSALGKLKSLNIRYLNMDKGLTAEDKSKLAKLFPNAQITETTNDSLTDTDNTPKDITPSDTAAIAKNTQLTEVVSPRADTVHYGTFNIQKDQFKILSPAYLYYASLFNNELYKNTFDSLMFDERYLDTNYISVVRRQPRGAFPPLSMVLVKNKMKQTWFTFFSGIASKYISKNNYELNAFKGMVWVYTGQLRKRKFRKTFEKKWPGKGLAKYWRWGFFKKQPVFWNDVRINYDQTNKTFTIELKNNSGFIKIPGYLRLQDEKSSPEVWQRQYTKRYARYLSLLNRRRNRFQKNLMKEKMLYDVSRQRSIMSTWTAFQRLYFSDEEKKLSMSEWLKYYDNVIANEKKALANADASIDNLTLYMQRENYLNSTYARIIVGDSSLHAVNTYYKDEEQNLLPVSAILLINQDDKTYCRYTGSLGLDPMLMYLSSDKALSIVIELRNGDIGILSKNKYAKDKLKGVSEYTFTVERISKKLGSVGQIIDILNL